MKFSLAKLMIRKKGQYTQNTEKLNRLTEQKGIKGHKAVLQINNHLTPHAQYTLCFFFSCSSYTKGITHLLAPEGDAMKRFQHDMNMQHVQQPDSSLGQWGTKKPGTILTWVQFHGAARDLFPQFSVQTLLRCLYTPLCNGMYKHLCTL